MTEPAGPPGRRERKKAQTRRAIADAALRLFLARGYDAVSVRDVAEAAEVSVSGVWKHFPCKEALVLDQGPEPREALLSCVRGRSAGADLLAALREHLLGLPAYAAPVPDDERAALDALVRTTPALRAHAERVWRQREEDLAGAVAELLPGVPDARTGAAALARFVLDRAPAHGQDPRAELAAAFAVLERGWSPARRRTRTDDGAAAAPQEPARQGLRERKKERTRRAVTDAAVALFLERGYERTGIREVADAADVSVSTLFAHFPEGKASLVFGEDAAGRGAALAAAVRGRPEGCSALRAVQGLLLQRGPLVSDPDPRLRRTLDLVAAVPELRDQARSTWLRSHPALAAALAEDAGLPPDDPGASVTARWLLQVPDLALAAAEPRRTVAVVVDLLESGWPAWLAARGWHER